VDEYGCMAAIQISGDFASAHATPLQRQQPQHQQPQDHVSGLAMIQHVSALPALPPFGVSPCMFV